MDRDPILDAGGLRQQGNLDSVPLDDTQDHPDFDPSSRLISPVSYLYGHDLTASLAQQHQPAEYHDIPDFDDRPSQSPAGAGVASHAAASVTPDDFYRSYQPLQAEQSPEILPMALTSSVPRPGQRSNSDANALRQNNVQSGRVPSRTSNLRSVSTPDTRQPVSTRRNHPTGKTSVKDLKKRFDQNGSTTSAIPRVPMRSASGTPFERDQPPATAKSRNGSATAATPYSSIRSGSAKDLASSPSGQGLSPRSNRSKFVAEDQVSSNSQSFASRISKPRGSLSSNATASKSMTNIHKSLSPRQAPVSPPLPTQPLLFGEILPGQSEVSALGFGIESLRPRRTSESSISPNVVNHHRTLSDPDIEPSSPSEWYRDDESLQNHPNGYNSSADFGHSRSRSDAAQSNCSEPTIRNIPIRSAPSPAPSQTLPNSKLPLSVRKPDNRAASPSLSTDSPATLKRAQANGRTSRTGIATARAKTPTDHASISPGLRRKQVPENLMPRNGASKLQAYAATPPEKLSPTLRSSRPRQPVSMASTASSRMKAVERARSPNKLASRIPSHAHDAPVRRRKISVGPVDFEQRREHIRLAYSKSIRESQALEARQKAAERRKKDMEAAARAKIAAAKAATDLEAASAQNLGQYNLEKASDKGAKPTISTPSPALSPFEEAAKFASVVPSHPDQNESTALLPESAPENSEAVALEGAASPDLGLPGGFPSISSPLDEEPLSAVSTTSGITEFEVEPETEPVVLAESPIDGPVTIVNPPTPKQSSSSYRRSEYRYPFEDEMESPEVQSSEGFRSREQYAEPSMPGAFFEGNDEDGDALSKHATEPKVTILPPPPEDDTRQCETSGAVPFPRLEIQDESDCNSEYLTEQDALLDDRTDHDDATTDACTEETDDRERIEGFQQESPLGDQSSYHASTCESSDAGVLDEPPYSSYDEQYTADTSHGLLPPHAGGDRFSQQSAWTDISVETADPSSKAASPLMDVPESPAYGHVTIFESPSLTRDHDQQFREVDLHNSQLRPSVDSSRSSAWGQHRLSDVSAGDDFSVSQLSPGLDRNFSYMPSPSHEPPLPPNSGTDSAAASRRTSAFYDQSQRNSAVLSSERVSGDFTSQADTPQSLDDASLETRETPSSEVKSLSTDNVSTDAEKSKERRRLVQRRNVVKELVDTEAVFVRDMNIVEEIYKGTAEACPKLDDKTIKLVFRNSEEIVEFHTAFLAQVKAGVASIYIPKGGRTPKANEDFGNPDSSQLSSTELSDENDYRTSIGPVFKKNLEKMKTVHEAFLRNSDHAAKKLIQIQQDPTVKVWLTECNEVAKDLTAAWDLDSLLIKPMQRITKYPNLIVTLLQHTPSDHPDREELLSAKEQLETAIIEINKTKKNFELVGQIVGRKRKESDVKAGIARAFGKRVDKLQTSGNRPPEDPTYAKLNERFGDDYLRLQVVLRDVEFYTRQVSAYVHEFLQYLSSIELVMRLQPGSYPEIESKWVQFNISVRDLEKIALEDHLSQVRKHVIEPFELVIKAYGNPSLAMKKRQKRRLDFERAEQLRRGGKSVDSKLKELVEQYEALNDTLKKELPMLSALTEKIGNICLGNFVNIQAKWYFIWKEKMKTVLGDCPDMPDLKEVVSTFQKDYPYAHEQLASIGIANPSYRGRASQSTTMSGDDSIHKIKSRPSDLDTRSRGLSFNGDLAPSLPTPDFVKRHSGSFTMSPSAVASVPSPHHYYYKDYYSGIQTSSTSMGSASMMSHENASSMKSALAGATASTRPSTGRSYDSGGLPRQSSDSAAHYKRDSSSYTSPYLPQDSRRFSGLFQSALPLPDGPDESRRSSRASSGDRGPPADSYRVLWLAASLFEFNISTTKHEAGYPYLIYQAGEIFDVVAEKGELWLAKNQDDPAQKVGWIWSKHFAKLADS